MSEVKRYRKGHFVAIGLAIGIPAGVPIGLILGNIALGPLIGLAIGLVVGQILERRWNKHPVHVSDEDKRRQNVSAWVLILIGLILLLLLTGLYFQQA